MDWYNRKTRRNTFRLTGLIFLLAGAYFLYAYYRKANLSDYERQNSYTGMKRADTGLHPETRTFVASLRQADSMKAVAIADSSFYNLNRPFRKQDDTAMDKPVATPQNKPEPSEIKEASHTDVLSGPSAVFSHTYTISTGKTVPVNVAWTDDGVKTSRYKLITIGADDIAGGKAWFTIEDPFNVLLFSQTGYGVNDRIVIKDDRHDLDIRVVQVHNNSVVINVVSHLDDRLVSGLQKMR